MSKQGINVRAIYHLTGKFSTDCIGILFVYGPIVNSYQKINRLPNKYCVAQADSYNQGGWFLSIQGNDCWTNRNI